MKNNDEKPKVLMVPGLWGSGTTHWQTIWEEESPDFIRVEQNNWNSPDLHAWMVKLNEYVEAATSPVILVAHSLACALVANWANHYHTPIHGALLVAPTDSDVMIERDPEIASFCPMPILQLHFKSILVASQDDECVSFKRAKYFAQCWGSGLIDVGCKGHINADSGLGSWPDGRSYLNMLV